VRLSVTHELVAGAREPPFGVAEQVFQQILQQCLYEVICARPAAWVLGVWRMAGRILGALIGLRLLNHGHHI
jgi:hypothetical protein